MIFDDWGETFNLDIMRQVFLVFNTFYPIIHLFTQFPIKKPLNDLPTATLQQSYIIGSKFFKT